MSREEFDIAVRSHRLHAQRFGSPTAPLIVGLHGLSLNMKSFDFLGERLRGDALQLVALDLRGRGHSERTPPGTYGWENHALDVFAVADALGFERFSLVGQSMGGSVGAVIGSVISGLDKTYDSVEQYLDVVKDQGLAEPWNEYWDRCYRYGLEARDGRVRARVHPDAVAEDRAYGLTQNPYDRWKHLTMPTLLLRATQEIRPGAGHVVPADDREPFLRDVPRGSIVEVDANHLTINTQPRAAIAIGEFLADVLGR